MAVFVEGRIKISALLLAGGWYFSGEGSHTSLLLSVSGLAYGSYAVFLLVKTLQAVVLGPYLWTPLSRLVCSRDLTREEFFRCDEAPEDIATKRETALDSLSQRWAQRDAKQALETQQYLIEHFSDVRFKASGFESMYPCFQKVVNTALLPHTLTLVDRADGCELTDIGGDKILDSSGCYGVNCFGYTRTKHFMREGQKLAEKLGPCLGPMHPVVADNIKMLLRIFNKEEVSFHMSGTEAVMSAVYQARFHTQRPLTAVFQGKITIHYSVKTGSNLHTGIRLRHHLGNQPSTLLL